jgi:trk system potassium uptake protein TrkA
MKQMATKVVFPNKEVAKRVTPLLFSSTLLSYMPISGKMSIAELKIPKNLIGKTLVESELREKYRLNLVSIRDANGEYVFCPADYVFDDDDIGLFSGGDADGYKGIIEKFMKFIGEKRRVKRAPRRTLWL